MSQAEIVSDVPQSQVAAQLEEMEQLHNELHKAILGLNDRLSPVLTDEPKEKMNETASVPGLVPLADVLWNKNNFLRMMLGRLTDMRSRIEL